MNVQSHTDQFDFFVDARHYGFQWNAPRYILVAYAAIKEDDKVIASIENITAEPWLISSIVIHNNWMTVSQEMIEAAQDAAEKYFNRNSHVDETILGSIAGYITH